MSRIDGADRPFLRRRQLKRVVGAAAILVVTSIPYFTWHDHQLIQPNRDHAMNSLTAKMKTICLGRYLIDVPADAEVTLGYAESDSNKIGRIPSFASNTSFAEYIQEREAKLRSAKHNTEGSLLKSVTRSSNERQTVFVSRPKANDTYMYLVEAFVHAPPAAWHVSYETNDEYLKLTIDQIGEIAQSLSYRAALVIPTTAGACLEDGLLNRTPRRAEEFHGGARIEALSWTLNLTSETSGPRDNVNNSDLFKRVDDAMSGAGSGIETLRRAKVQADGRSGQEYVALYAENNASIVDAKFELYGNRKPQQPTIKLQMESGSPIKRDPRDTRRFLTHDEALAVWDAIIKTIRPRPGAF